MSYHPPGSRPVRMSTGVGRAPTGYKLTTGMRPGSRAGVTQGGALNSQIAVPDRPVTQQGLGGMGTGIRGPVRQVQDRSYYLGILRSKIGELNNEIMKLSRELEQLQQDSATYLTYEKRAEVLAGEVEDLRGELADYNTLIDKLSTDTEVDVILADYNTLCRQNDIETRAIDTIFAEKQQKEIQLNQIETAIEQEKQLTETLVESMDSEVQEKYRQLKTENLKIKTDIEEKEKELDMLTTKAQRMEEEVNSSELKQQAFQLHQQLAEVIAKRDEWRSKEQETPEQERERLLKQVKHDNQEISSLERRLSELQDSLDRAQDQLRQTESDLDQVQGERADKLRDLKTKEKQRKEFLDTFEEQKDEEMERIHNLEENIVTILEHISQTMTQSQNLPSVPELQEMQEDLIFKQEEMKKAANTVDSLETQNSRLQNDLLKVEELEEKIKSELHSLREGIDVMTKEIEVYSELDKLQFDEEEKKQALLRERERLLERKETAKQNAEELSEKYEAEKNQLEKNDTFTQLGNLEKKLQYLEQTNFVMKEYIATRQTEGNYQNVAKGVISLQQNYNDHLVKALQP